MMSSPYRYTAWLSLVTREQDGSWVSSQARRASDASFVHTRVRSHGISMRRKTSLSQPVMAKPWSPVDHI
jgi:hypothetical protein